jgi:hypothetical protein
VASALENWSTNRYRGACYQFLLWEM